MKKKLQVFVSSTFTDLIVERQAAVSAILKLGHIPAGMELFTANDKSQWETIKQWIDESDVYMLILGGRYGSIESSTGISYTELEYNYALEIGKPLFSIVINESALDEKVKRDGRSCIESENPVALKSFKDKVLTHMSSFFDDIKDIKIAVMESLPQISSRDNLSGWISGSEVPDTKALIDEIGILISENEKLKRENENLKKVKSKVNVSSEEESFEELESLLSNIELDIPPRGPDDEEYKNNLLILFTHLWEAFVTGVTNQIGKDELHYFIYNDIAPKLQIHGLVINEKVTGVKYRRFTLTSKGQSFAAYLIKKEFMKK